jgi:hypothetical protein
MIYLLHLFVFSYSVTYMSFDLHVPLPPMLCPAAAHRNAPIVRDPAGTGKPPFVGSYGVDNPAPLFFPNGSLLMLGRDAWNSVGRIVAPHWRGPYTLGRLIGPAPFTVEDPFLYRDVRGAFHALFHGGKQGGDFVAAGAHAFSADGHDWVFSAKAAYTTTVNTSDGLAHTFTRRERPHLLFAGGGGSGGGARSGMAGSGEAGASAPRADTHTAVGGIPTHLSTSLWVGPADHTVTFIQALNTA